jgi:DNA-binding CsgD family transcriptional regulator
MSMVDSSPTTHSELLERAHRLRRLADQLETEALALLERVPEPTLELESHRWWAQVIQRDPPKLSNLNADSPEELVYAAVLHSMRGNAGQARQLAARAERMSSGTANLMLGVTFARAIAWMSDGKCDAAFDALSAQFEAQDSSASLVALASTSGVLAEIAIRANRANEARAVLDPWMPVIATLAGPERQEFDLAGLLLRELDRVNILKGAFGASRAWTPFATARIQLAIGMTLRRERHTRDARSHLLIAVDLFAELGVEPWLAVAQNELRVSGVRSDSEPGSNLSEQERSVVELASKGLSNREIGERLYLSPRTVGSHLYRVFPKLGITSRHQLVER